ncbi:MAG TPA: hypothetical protein VER32_15550 [Pyrinomonadaceae bacterium]|nr:hypothetical protein [Pyrinomonadaceae bacterium]
MKNQKNGLAALMLALALAHTTFAGVIHGPNEDVPDGPRMVEEVTPSDEGLEVSDSLTTYALETLQTIVALIF